MTRSAAGSERVSDRGGTTAAGCRSVTSSDARRRAAHGGVPGRVLVPVGVAIALVWLATGAARISRLAWSGAEDLAGVAALGALAPANPAYDHILARADLASGNPAAAAARLESALDRNPLPADLWIDLARASIARGNRAGALGAALAARRRDPTSAAVCYDAAVVLLQVRAVAPAIDALGCVVDLAPSRTAEIYDLAFAVLGDAATVRAAIPPTERGWRGYFGYARRRRPDEVELAWRELVRRGATDADRVNYVGFLLDTGRAADAAAVWREAYGGRGTNLVFNGSFERDPIGGGLDWIIRPCAGAATMIAALQDAPDGERAIEVVFDGTNADYRHLHQIVPVEGGRRYGLRATVRTENITSLTGPRLTVSGYRGCALRAVTGREWRATTPWTQETIRFSAPQGCGAVVVRLERPLSNRFDRNISGRLYLDDIEVGALEDEPA